MKDIELNKINDLKITSRVHKEKYSDLLPSIKSAGKVTDDIESKIVKAITEFITILKIHKFYG